MIADKDRSGWFGASDTSFVVGNWKTATFEKWWLQKLGINTAHFDNKYTLAGTYFEHRILDSLGFPMEFDRQFTVEQLLLRVNLDGNTDDMILECKTYGFGKGFRMPQKYIQQVNVQMFATGFRKAKIIAYGLVERDYDNFFGSIDPNRRSEHPIQYDELWVNNVYLPKLKYLAECLKEGRFPCR